MGFNPAWFGLLALGLPALLWVGLAWKRALEDDPHRLRRAGSRELQRLLGRIHRAGRMPGRADLHAWCRAVARSWGVQVSTPTGTQLARSMSALDADAGKQAHWQELWKTTERGLYGQEATLAPDWIGATTAAANELRVPPRKYWLPARLRHWLPSVSAAALRLRDPRGRERSVAGYKTACHRHWMPRPTAILSAAQAPAAQALRLDWNNWAAHYNVGAEQIAQGNVDYAVAHLTRGIPAASGLERRAGRPALVIAAGGRHEPYPCAGCCMAPGSNATPC